LPYSLVRRSWVEDPAMMQAVNASGAGVIASFCLAGGVLTGKYRSSSVPGRAAGTLDDPRVAAAVAAAGELASLAGRLETTPAALALAFPLTNPAVTSVLFGSTARSRSGLLRRDQPAGPSRPGRPRRPTAHRAA
jgi:aryl-alcohol dehydrogenase-like predicted oxidoreductase